MNSQIIEVQNLSKVYNIAHRQPYETFRDAMTELAKKPFHLLKGKKKNRKENFFALKDINFTINKGERVGIIGRNGAGKSTLLKILSRITWPTTGKAILRGRAASLLEVGTGFHPELTGRENIFLNGSILGMKRREIIKKFKQIVEFSEIEKFLDTPVKRYSSGMFVRLAFAVAAYLDSEILLVDEVLAVGDIQFQKKCLGKMGDISSKEGRTIISVSHNMNAITQLCDRVLLISKGEIIKDGKTDDVIREYYKTIQDDNKNLDKRTDRSGDNRAKAVKVYLKDSAGNEIDHVKAGEPVEIVVSLALKQGAIDKDIGIFIGITDKEENRICVFKSPIFKVLGKENYVEFSCRIGDGLPFISEIYNIDLYIEVDSIKADKIAAALQFQVASSNFLHGQLLYPPNSKYPVLIKNAWSKY